MTTFFSPARRAVLVLALGLASAVPAAAQTRKPAGLRRAEAAAAPGDTGTRPASGTSLVPPKSAVAAEPVPPVPIAPKPVVGLSAAERRRINRAMTRPPKPASKLPARPPAP